jgi:hypothetical protein
MATHIAIEGQIPQPLEYLRTLLPDVSFPAAEMTDTALYTDIIALTAYEACTVGAVPALAWNQTAVLGVAARVGGALTASYTATNMASADSDAVLEAAREEGIAAMESLDTTVFNTVETFAATSTATEIDLRPNPETIANLSRLMAVAQNAEAGATVVDANGLFVTLTLDEIKEINAAVVERAAVLTNNRAVTIATIKNATEPSNIDAAISNHQNNYGP